MIIIMPYEERVAELEALGLTTSDAQGSADASELIARRFIARLADYFQVTPSELKQVFKQTETEQENGSIS